MRPSRIALRIAQQAIAIPDRQPGKRLEEFHDSLTPSIHLRRGSNWPPTTMASSSKRCQAVPRTSVEGHRAVEGQTKPEAIRRIARRSYVPANSSGR
jgi:hypothetical protein